jgi:hypothetical protein
MTDAGSGHAHTINSGPKWAASQANLRDQIGAGVMACAEVATAKAKPAAAINLIFFSSLVCGIPFLHPTRKG